MPAYLESLNARCWNAFCAEMEAEPFTAERFRLARRSVRLKRLRQAVNVRLMELGA
ncbi:hypothetical protein ACFFLM_06270 [Deinococcus oregonensis]|uniref:Transposase n=1 Tax=Deinococcus oregonensis TaxID=1805970 RepID=A0ABV6AY96_9DEIO